MEHKCKTCGESNLNNFYFRKDAGKLRSECKKCFDKRVAIYQNNNKEKLSVYKKQWAKDNKERLEQNLKIYYINNKDKILDRVKKYSKKHKEEKREYDRLYRQKNKNKINNYIKEYRKNRRKTEPSYKLRDRVSQSILTFLKSKKTTKNNKSFLECISYTMDDLKEHLEKQFEPWMNWNNHGKYIASKWNDNDSSTWTWQIDHIIPHSTFNYTSMEDEEFKKCWALSNLRPYSAKQNVIDGTSKKRH